MFSKHVTIDEAAHLLDFDRVDMLREAESQGLIKCTKLTNKKENFSIQDVVILKLALCMVDLGLSPEKALSYSEAALGIHTSHTLDKTMAWLDGETHELFCLFADKQLSRIFIRSLEDGREIDVGAEKPVLFPISRCELNISRAVRPVLTRANHLLASKKKHSKQAPAGSEKSAQ